MMITASQLLPFAAIALGLVLTPGPNMIYLVSRSISQGKRAGLISLTGVALVYGHRPGRVSGKNDG